MTFLEGFHPVAQAMIATLFTWGMTSVGASVVFFTKTPSKRVMGSMLGFAAGVMLSVSFWCLLAPAIELSEGGHLPQWLPATIGFLAGGLFIWVIDKVLPHLHHGFTIDKAEGVKTSLHRNALLVLAMTLHNLPEGLAIGVAFGALASNPSHYASAAAISLAIGIGVQNIPEGMVVAVPLRGDGMSPLKSFWYGQLSGLPEPLGALIGAFAVTLFQPLLPYALAFAAGSMIYVVIEELIPESQMSVDTDLATISTLIGFILMMILEVALE